MLGYDCRRIEPCSPAHPGSVDLLGERGGRGGRGAGSSGCGGALTAGALLQHVHDHYSQEMGLGEQVGLHSFLNCVTVRALPLRCQLDSGLR